jgi:glycosyltransferase involved in cell wall biosynthesis
MKKLVLFHRDFREFSGGHLKVWDYFNHVLTSAKHEPRIAFSAETRWDSSNPWLNSRDYVVEWEPEKADILFLAGTDWRAVPELGRSRFPKPIINLIQHPRHAEPNTELRNFLRNRAVRICVSQEVADAITATGEVNGPVFTIPNAIDLSCVPPGKPWHQRPLDVLICGVKAKDLARDLQDRLTDENRTIKCLTDYKPRQDFLNEVSKAKVTVFLPRPSEGFYLPALEGMAAETIVVCPDCLGNRGFCEDKVNCFRPEYGVDEIVSAAHAALVQSENERTQMLANATSTVGRHSLEGERKRFTEILEQIHELSRG